MGAIMPENEQGGTSALNKLFAHNAWANLKLLDFCEGLSDEQLDTTAIGGFGSIRNTLQHILGAEVSYVMRVNGRLPAKPLERNQFAGFEALKEAASWASDELLQLALSAREDTLVQERTARWHSEYTLASLIMQAITHSTEHRTQIATIITQMGMEPPDMSGWKYMDETGELKEAEEKGS
jgi:uncharacterized damage-inducible protein DinB